MYKTKSGFTLVELLIVIVIIAILAAITVVAYNGITARAQAVAMQTDLVNAAKKVRAFTITDDRFPQTTTDAAAMNYRFSFSPVGQNVVLCADASKATNSFAIVARNVSRSPQWYAYDIDSGKMSAVSPASVSAANLCATTNYPAYLWGTFWVQGG